MAPLKGSTGDSRWKIQRSQSLLPHRKIRTMTEAHPASLLFLISPHQHKGCCRCKKIDPAEKSQRKRLLYIFQRSKTKYISSKRFRSYIWKNLCKQRDKHNSSIFNQISDLLFLQKQKYQEIKHCMIFKGCSKSAHKGKLPHFPPKEK